MFGSSLYAGITTLSSRPLNGHLSSRSAESEPLEPPLEPSVRGDDPPQGEHIAVVETLLVQRQGVPRIPYGADQEPRDAVALGRAKEDGEPRRKFERRPTLRLLANCLLVEDVADGLRPCGEHLV